MYDIMIIGGGPAGVTAGIYAKRAGKNVVVFEKMFIGGQIATTSELENYPGFGKPISGSDFALELYAQCKNIGVEVKSEEVLSCDLESDVKVIETKKGKYEGKTVIIATGASVRKLGLMEEMRYTGRGVSYCATCDGSFYKGKTVAMVGGGNSAVEEAVYLSNIADKVYLIHRKDTFRADDKAVKKMLEKDNIETVLNSNVVKIVGSETVTGVIVKDNEGVERQIDLDGVFIGIGREPDTKIFPQSILNEKGYVVADRDMKTAIDGVFGAGDVCEKKLRQVVTAVSDGAIAVESAIEYLD